MTGFDARNALKLAARVLAKAAEERARGGRLLQDQYPTKYMPKVGRQVMAQGGEPQAYADPPAQHIQDWNWRPLEDVKQQLQLTEIPSHVAAFGSFMDETANKAGTKGLSARDLIKAYTITRASIQRRAVSDERLRQAGLELPDDVQGMVRPEGAFGHWLHTDMGQRYLKAAERGLVDMESVRNAVQVMAPFGKHEKDIPDALMWAAQNLPGREEQISRLVAAAQQMQSDPEEWRRMARQFRGIGPSKSGFVASVMGRGDQPTLDARQLILHTDKPTSEAQPFLRRKSGEGASEAVDRLAARQAAMGLQTPSGMEPYYQHLTHHAVWDKAADEETTHQDVMDAMRHAADGGRIEADESSVLSHPVAQVMASMGAPGIPEAPVEMEKQLIGGSDEPLDAREAGYVAAAGRMPEPKNTVMAYKLFRTKKSEPGKLFPLFVRANEPVPIGEWVVAKEGEKGKAEGKVKSSLGDLAYRPGWHSGDLPIATHIGGRSHKDMKLPPDYRPDNQVWALVEHPADVDWQSVANDRAQYTKDGRVDVRTAHVTDQVPLGGFYRYKTNPNMTGNWLISGGMKVHRLLSDDEVKEINDRAGTADLPRFEKILRKKELDAFGKAPELAEGFKRGGASPDETELQRRMKAILREDEQDPERAAAYMQARQSYEMPTHERGAYSSRVLPMPASDVQTTIGDIPGVTPKQANPLTWNGFHKIGKGGTLFTLGGDRSNLGRLTHINGKELAWPVDLHAGTKYMTEPNEGAVWANAKGAASALRANILKAAEKGPVYGAFAPMGPTAIDSSTNMMDTLLAQVPTSDMTPEAAEKFDSDLRNGLHVKGTDPISLKKRERAAQIMEDWPGIRNAEQAAEFTKKLSGEHRATIVKHMEMAPFQNAGFPSVGVTRAAITDPELLDAAGNLMGQHIVELDPDTYDPKNLSFEHSTYPVPTKGKLVGKIPMIERQVAMPDYTDEQVMHPAVLKKTGEPLIIHPYSPNALGRSSYRGNTEMRQAIQPINERMLESIQKKHGSDFAKGGKAEKDDGFGSHPAHDIPGIHIVGHSPVFTGER